MLPLAPTETMSLRTRDGVRLDADVHRPASGGPYPVLLMRQPYGRAIASTGVLAHPRWYAAHGFIVVIQDVRGRGSSEGAFSLFATEGPDGADTIRWAARLAGSTGEVGLYGFSYQGNTQLLAAATLYEEEGAAGPLKAMAPGMVGWRNFDDWAYEGDAFVLAGNVGWGVQMATEQARLAGDEAAYLDLKRAASAPPLDGPVPARPDLLTRHRAYGHYPDWVDHDTYDRYWQAMAPAERMYPPDVPMLHIGGWYDGHLPGTMAAWEALSATSTAAQHLIIGPWQHLNWLGRYPADRGDARRESPIDPLLVAWFRRWLTGAPDAEIPVDAPDGLSAAGERRVTLFTMGVETWRTGGDWPAVTPMALYPASGGRAALTSTDGTLSPDADMAGEDTVVHDPWRPAPSLGGRYGFPGGRVDRRDVDLRSDVLVYTGAPLATALTLTGEVSLTLALTIDQPGADIHATLAEVRPDGAAIHLCDGHRRFTDEDVEQPLPVTLRWIAATIPAGHRLRLSLALAAYPAFPVNSGTGARVGDERAIAQRVITARLHWGGEHATALTLPVQQGSLP